MQASNRCARGLAALGLMAVLLASDGGLAEGDTCRQWRAEHSDWTIQVVRLYLTGGGRQELDAALFELLQREAYLTSCPTSLPRARGSFVGWQLVDRTPDEYGAAVVGTLLLRAGFPERLRDYFGSDLSVAMQPGRHRGRRAAYE